MKKLSVFVVGSVLLAAVVVCGMQVTAVTNSEPEGKLLMLTNEGELGESAAKRALWQGVCTYASEHGYKAWLVVRSENTVEASLQALENSLSSSVVAVIGMGKDDETVFYEAQQRYPEISFLLVDGEPRRSTDSVYETRTNTHCLLFREREAGFLAGYAAVMDGKRHLGFCGQNAEPGVVRYGYGFIQGAEAAATILGLGNGDITIQYWYLGADRKEDAIQSVVSQWYQRGTEVIFVCDQEAQALTNAVIATAKEVSGLVIATDTDQGMQGEVVLSSTVKDYAGQVYAALSALEDNEGRWNAERAGRSFHVGVSEGAISLAKEPNAWRWKTFTPEAYEAVLSGLKQGAFVLNQSENRERLPLAPHCTVKMQK